jgi:putative ABC transport system substrate-binding protein
MVEQRAGALLISSGAFSPAAIDQVLSLARRYAVPTLFFTRDRVVSGGLASYGTPASEVLRQVGIYTGRLVLLATLGAMLAESPVDLIWTLSQAACRSPI